MGDSLEEINKLLDDMKNCKYESLEEQLAALEHLNDEIENKLGLTIPQARLPMTLTKLNLIVENAVKDVACDFAKARQLENMLNQFVELLTDFMKENK